MTKNYKNILLIIVFAIISLFILGEKNISEAYNPNTDPTVTIQFDDQIFYNIVKRSAQARCKCITDDNTMTLKIYEPDIKNITGIDSYNDKQEIKSIKGIEKLTSLTQIYFPNNKIKDLTPLSNLKDITSLELQDNEIADISPLNNLKNLTYLNLSYNQITDISYLKNKSNLKYLYLSVNKITDISSLKDLIFLEELALSENNISDISSLNNLTNIEELNLSYNVITKLCTLSNKSKLNTLELAENRITNFDELINLKPSSTLVTTLYKNNIKESDIRKILSNGIQVTDIYELGGENSNVFVDDSDKEYTGNPIKPRIWGDYSESNGWSISASSLTEGEDFTVNYVNNVNVGTATIKIQGKGKFIGSITKTFKIVKANLKKATVIGINNKTYTGKKIKQTITVKDGSKTLKEGTDYTLTYKDNKKVGTATVIITGKENYTGTIKKTFKINPKGTSLKKLTAGKKQFKATWGKNTNETTGYEIQYSTNKNFKSGNKKSKIKKNKTTSGTIKRLKAKKKYYVRIRTYKTVNGKTYYSSWSSTKNVTTKK